MKLGEKIQQIYPGYEIGFTIGSDNLKELHIWKNAEELTQKYKIYVLERDRDNIEDIIKNNDFLNKNKNAFIKAKNNITSNLSSTFVRNKIKNRKSIRYLTSDEIIQYIKENRLYCNIENNYIIGTNTESTTIKGDINKDGKVTLYDAFRILRYVILGESLTDEQIYIMDYNGDKKVTLYDAFRFLRQVILE